MMGEESIEFRIPPDSRFYRHPREEDSGKWIRQSFVPFENYKNRIPVNVIPGNLKFSFFFSLFFSFSFPFFEDKSKYVYFLRVLFVHGVCRLVRSLGSKARGMKVDVFSFSFEKKCKFESFSNSERHYASSRYIDCIRSSTKKEKFLRVFERRNIIFQTMNRLRFRSKRQALLLYIYSLIRVVCFKCVTKCTSRGRGTMDSCVWIEQIRESRRENRSYCMDFLHRYVKLGKHQRKRRSLLRFTISNLSLERRRRSCAKREQHVREYSWKFEKKRSRDSFANVATIDGRLVG